MLLVFRLIPLVVLLAIATGQALSDDHPWYFTAEEMDSAYRYQENYGRRLRHPLDPSSPW